MAGWLSDMMGRHMGKASIALDGQGNGRRERGVAVLEFAIASTVMVTLLFGILAYGEILAHYIQLRYVVGEVARQVAVGPDADDRNKIFTDLHDDMVQSFVNDAVPTGCATLTYAEEGTGATTKAVISGEYKLTDACRFMPAILPIPDNLEVFNRFLVRG